MWKTTLLILREKCSGLQSSPGCSSAVRCWRAEGGNAVSKIRRFCAEPGVGEPEPDLAASRETESRADQVVWWALASVPSLQHSTPTGVALYWMVPSAKVTPAWVSALHNSTSVITVCCYFSFSQGRPAAMPACQPTLSTPRPTCRPAADPRPVVGVPYLCTV